MARPLQAAPPSRFVLLLRGVNVGSGHKVPMAELRALLASLGHGDVSTLLNSGNAVFTASTGDAAMHARAIAATVQARFGVTTPAVVKSAAEFAAIVDGNPFPPPATAHAHFLVAFAMDPAALEALEGLQAQLQPGERLAVTPRAAYLHCPGGVLESRVGAAMLGPTGRRLTTRNWGTVLKISARLAALAD
jgi:uncharacterized protein (DUF1697 family)